MIHYELIKTTPLQPNATLFSRALPELVHLDDPALLVMTDFSHTDPVTVDANSPMDDALNEMKLKGVHLLIVVDAAKQLVGIISSEDLIGEKPITLVQRVGRRDQVLVKMLMTPLNEIPAFALDDLERARVGNVVNTLKSCHQHYALAVKQQDDGSQIIRGIFTTSQISRQLHMEVSDAIAKAHGVSELIRQSNLGKSKNK